MPSCNDDSRNSGHPFEKHPYLHCRTVVAPCTVTPKVPSKHTVIIESTTKVPIAVQVKVRSYFRHCNYCDPDGEIVGYADESHEIRLVGEQKTVDFLVCRIPEMKGKKGPWTDRLVTKIVNMTLDLPRAVNVSREDDAIVLNPEVETP